MKIAHVFIAASLGLIQLGSVMASSTMADQSNQTDQSRPDCRRGGWCRPGVMGGSSHHHGGDEWMRRRAERDAQMQDFALRLAKIEALVAKIAEKLGVAA